MAIHPGPGPDPACRQVTRIGDRRRRVAHAHRAARRHADPKPKAGRGMPRVAVRLVGDHERPKGIVPGEILVHERHLGAAREAFGDVPVEVRRLDCDLPVCKLVVDLPQHRLDALLLRLEEAGVPANPNHVLPFAMRGKASVAPEMGELPKRPVGDGVGKGVRVVVIDTGIDPDALRRKDGWLDDITVDGGNADPLNVINEEEGELSPNGTPYLDDAAGHGTFVAGIVRQVAPACDVVVMRVLDSDGIGSEEALACAIDRAGRLEPRPAVINLSLGQETVSGHPPVAVAAALDALDDGIMVVAAAGNSPDDEPTWPAAFRRVVGVGGLTGAGEPANWSKHGTWVDCSAVAEELVSTYVGGIENPDLDPDGIDDVWTGSEPAAVWIGTSFAAPRVSGLIAAGVSRGMTPREAYAALCAEAAWRPGHGHLILA